MEEKKLTPQQRYDKANTRYIGLKLNIKTDADVIDWLERQASMQGAIKGLVREKIEKGQEAGEAEK